MRASVGGSSSSGANNKRNSSWPAAGTSGGGSGPTGSRRSKSAKKAPFVHGEEVPMLPAKGPASRSSRSQRTQSQQRQHQQHQRQVALTSASRDGVQDAGANVSDEHRKQNHCEIEKRRRDKMNHYIMELASVIPSFNNNQSKFDKLTVLRMAVQHVKSLRSSLCSFSSFHLRPSFLSSGNLLKNLILQMAGQESQDNLFMVVTCDRAKVLFVSESSKDILNQDQHELVGQCLFDILHKEDVSKVKEQISHFNLTPKEMLVDSKTLQPIKRNQRQSFGQINGQANSTPQPGARRSFFCRMKSGKGGIVGTSTVAQTTSAASTDSDKSGTLMGPIASHQNSQQQQQETIRIKQFTSSNKLPDNTTSSVVINQQQQQQGTSQHSNRTQIDEEHKQNVATGGDKNEATSADQQRTNSDVGGSGNNGSGDGDSSSGQTEAAGSPLASSDSSSASPSSSTSSSSNSTSLSPSSSSSSPSSSSSSLGNRSSSSESSSGQDDAGKTIAAALTKQKQQQNISNSTQQQGDGNSDSSSSSSSMSSSSSGKKNKSSKSRDCNKTTNSKQNTIIKGHMGGVTRRSDTAPSSIRGDNGEGGIGSDGGGNGSSSSVDSGGGGDDGSSREGSNSKVGSSGSSSSRNSSSGIASGHGRISSDQSSCNESLSSSSKAIVSLRAGTSASVGGAHKLSQTNSGASGVHGGAGSSKGSNSSQKHKRYIVMHCTGYLKSITLRNDEFDEDDYDGFNSENNSSDDDESNNHRTINCLVAVCRRSPLERNLAPDRPLTFTCRYSMEGKFMFVDQRTTVALGYTPQQLLGTSHYTYCHKDSVNTFKECHRQSILKSEPVSSDIYQFKRANGQHLWLQTSLKSFRNPWTKFIDYIVANHTTAEGNEPHYNEGCVPTKFNQDMTGENSQSSSPASSLSLPSMDSKKSSSPSSSSIGSSYSMESYVSGGSIQALLNQIDRVKSGGVKHPLVNHHRKKSDKHLSKLSGGSTRKSNEDSGNFSDPQSCSSLSSQISAVSGEYINVQGNVNYFADTGGSGNNRLVTNVNTGRTTLPINGDGNNFYCQKMSSFRAMPQQDQQQQQQNLCPPSDYAQPTSCQQQQQQSDHQFESSANSTSTSNLTTIRVPNRSLKTGPRLPVKPMRPHAGHFKLYHQRLHGHQYHNRSPPKSSSSNSSQTGNESACWASSSCSVYSSTSSHASGGSDGLQVSNVRRGQALTNKAEQQQIQEQACQFMNKIPQYVIPSVEPMNIVPNQASVQHQMSGISGQVGENYSSELIAVPTFMSQGVGNESSYNRAGSGTTDVVSLNRLQQNMSMTMQPQQQQQQQQQQQHGAEVQRTQQQAGNSMSVPMMWNPTTSGSVQQATPDPSQGNVNSQNPYQTMNTNPNMNERQQICTTRDVTLMNMNVGNSNNQMIAQPSVQQCQQCANHKCSIPQFMMTTNNTDLNSINLTSLAVDGDLDEDQLLEYLADCEPETQLYHIQNQAYTQYNI